MTLSLLTQADDKAAAYRPITWEVTSNRTPFQSLNVTAVADSGGGFCQFTVGTHAFKQFDVVTGSGFGDSSYNVRAQVTGFSATTINVDIPFNATDTGLVTRTNDDFKVRATVYTYEGAQYNLFGMGADFDGNLKVSSFGPHGLAPGDWVKMAGTPYDGIHEIVRINAPDQFVIAETFTSGTAGTANNLNRLGTKIQTEIIVASTALFRFNFSNFLQADLTHDIAPITGTNDIVTPNDNSERVYIVDWVEQYNDKNNLTADQDTLQNDTGKQVFNITHQHLDEQDLSDFTVNTAAKSFLTNTPDNTVIRRDEDGQLHFITTLDPVTWRVTEYSQISGGGPINTTTGPSIPLFDDRGIINFTGWNLLPNTVRIEVQLMEGTGSSPRSRAHSFLLKPALGCDKVRIKWLNRFGGVDSYTFLGDSTRSVSSKKTTFTKGLGIDFSKSDQGDTILGVEAFNTYSAWSEFVNLETAIWLEELITSPQAWRVSGTDLVPIIVQTDKANSNASAGLTQLGIVYRDANRLILQNG